MPATPRTVTLDIADRNAGGCYDRGAVAIVVRRTPDDQIVVDAPPYVVNIDGADYTTDDATDIAGCILAAVEHAEVENEREAAAAAEAAQKAERERIDMLVESMIGLYAEAFDATVSAAPRLYGDARRIRETGQRAGIRAVLAHLDEVGAL